MAAFSDLTKYGAKMAKVKVMKRSMLTNSDYLELINKKNIQEATSFLKNETVYGKYLSNVSEHDIHRDKLERLLNKSYIDDMIKLYKFENKENKKFYTYVYIKAEIEIIKITLRRIINKNKDIGYIYDVPDFYKKHFTINPDLLLKSNSIKEFLENLAGSRYESVMYPLISLKEHQNLFSIEMTLDLYYYSLVARLRGAIADKEDKEILDETVGSEVDMINLLWIYRCKRYYKMPNELIYTFIIPNKHKLSKKNIIDLVEAGSFDEFFSIVNKTVYKKAFENTYGEFFEKSYASFVYEMHKKLAKKYPFSIEAVNAYLHFKEVEINNITSIIEGIRYGPCTR